MPLAPLFDPVAKQLPGIAESWKHASMAAALQASETAWTELVSEIGFGVSKRKSKTVWQIGTVFGSPLMAVVP